MSREISDNRLKHLWQHYINSHFYELNSDYDKLKSQMLCGSKVIHQPGTKPKVYIVTNDDESRLFGVANCNSPWCCPKCAPLVMAKVGEKIACALDALAKWHNQWAVMITFTIPHTEHMSCKTTFNILRNTWRMFTKAGNKATRKDKYVKVNGEVSLYTKNSGAYGKFRTELQSVHNVRVYETTWGKNAWHPHIHALYWFPRDKFYKCVDYEEELLNLWWRCAEFCTLKYFNNLHSDKESIAKHKEMVKNLYANWRKYPKTGHRSVWISKNEDGSPRRQFSSYYISGWTGDFEMTCSSAKDAREQGHYAPHQLLEEAYNAKIKGNKNDYEKYMSLYTEFAIATKKAIRSQFSLSGINQIIRQWKQSTDFYELQKKRFTEQATNKKPWYVVIWLNEKQWSDISFLDRHEDIGIIPNLLDMAKAKLPAHFRRRAIATYLLRFGIDITQNDPNDEDCKFVSSKLFENKIIA